MKTKIWCILKKELREMFRDQKSLAMMLIIPLMIPALILGMSALFDMQVNKPITDYNKIGFSYQLDDAEEAIIAQIGIDAVYDTKENLIEKYNNQEIHLYVTREGNNYIINGEDNTTTAYATSLVENYLTTYKEHLQKQYLQSHEVSPDDVINIITLEHNLTEQENYYANYITVYAFLFIIMAITVSATYPATDATAGEKERGTLETLLTFPIKSRDIILGKFLSVTLSSIITGLISLILMLISLSFANDLFTIYKDINLLPSLMSIIFSIITIIAYSFLISGLCIALASTSKTFKEAQSTLTPLTFISFFPSMIAFMIEIKTTAILSLVPFLNFTLIFTDIVNKNINYLHIFLMLLSSFIFIALIFSIIIKQYKSEKILFSNQK